MIELNNMQTWKSTTNDRVIERIIIDYFTNSKGAKTVKYKNYNGITKYTETEEKFRKWISLHNAKLKEFEKPQVETRLIKAESNKIEEESKQENFQSTKDEVETRLIKAAVVANNIEEESKQENFQSTKDEYEPSDDFPLKEPSDDFPLKEDEIVEETSEKLSKKSVIFKNFKELPNIVDFTMFKPNERTSIYIDGQNLYYSIRDLGFDQMDFKKLYEFFDKKTTLLRCHYYNYEYLLEDGHSIMKPFTDWLQFNKYQVYLRSGKKSNIDSDLIVDVMTHAYRSRLDHIVLFSGDVDYLKMIKAVQELGIKVTVISTIKTLHPHCAIEVRKQTDFYIDLLDLKYDFELKFVKK
jgi:uncharacterized LabA/DUF88 family protein